MQRAHDRVVEFIYQTLVACPVAISVLAEVTPALDHPILTNHHPVPKVRISVRDRFTRCPFLLNSFLQKLNHVRLRTI